MTRKQGRSSNALAVMRKLRTLLLIAAAVLAGYGIYEWTSYIEAREQQRKLAEAQEILDQQTRQAHEEAVSPAASQRAYIPSFPLRDPSSYAGRQLPEIGETTAVRSQLESYFQGEEENIRIYEQFNRSVVNITSETYRLDFFLEPVPEEDTGSGTIFDSDGYVLTNYHVVDNAEDVYITLYDGSVFEGEIIGKDRESDLAVIKFDPGAAELHPVEFADPDADLRVGQKVLAIGNPFGYDRTLTTGIISGLRRPIRTDENLILTDMIQIDASINPGNSGGPLLNARGEMIGINTSIHSPTGSSVGIGFAVPIGKIYHIIPELIEHGQVIRGWLDITPVQLDKKIVEYAGLPVSEGILVSQVKSGGLAEEAGIRGGTEAVRYGSSVIYLGGDIIVEVAGEAIKDYTDLFEALEKKKPGDTVDVVLVRDRRMRSLQVELVKRPESYQWH